MEHYLKRHVYNQILEWKQQSGHSTLEVSGAYQMEYIERIAIFARKDVL